MTPQREREVAKIMEQAYKLPVEEMFDFLSKKGFTNEDMKVALLVKLGIDIGKRLHLEVV